MVTTVQTIKLNARVGTDGVLKLEVPLDVADADLEVVVIVQPRDGASRRGRAWPPGYFEQTSGALADDPIVRAPQGEYEQREPLSQRTFRDGSVGLHAVSNY
jgi:hypothetical protein